MTHACGRVAVPTTSLQNPGHCGLRRQQAADTKLTTSLQIPPVAGVPRLRLGGAGSRAVALTMQMFCSEHEAGRGT